MEKVKNITVAQASKHSVVPEFKNVDELKAFWQLTQDLFDTVYYRVAQLYKSNMWEFSDLTEKDQATARVEMRNRLLDIASLLHITEQVNGRKMWTVYQDSETGELNFGKVPEEERLTPPASKEKVRDVVRLMDTVINYKNRKEPVKHYDTFEI